MHSNIACLNQYVLTSKRIGHNRSRLSSRDMCRYTALRRWRTPNFTSSMRKQSAFSTEEPSRPTRPLQVKHNHRHSYIWCLTNVGALAFKFYSRSHKLSLWWPLTSITSMPIAVSGAQNSDPTSCSTSDAMPN